MLKSYLQRKGVQYEEKNVDDNPELMAEVYEKSGYQMVPVTVIDDQVITGLNIGLISKALML